MVLVMEMEMEMEMGHVRSALRASRFSDACIMRAWGGGKVVGKTY